MNSVFDSLIERLGTWAEKVGIRVQSERFGPETAAKFDGLSVTLNPVFLAEDRAYYLAHALGTIVTWSLHVPNCQAVIDDLRDAKAGHGTTPLEEAIARYRAFEERTSEYAVGLLSEIGCPEFVHSYSNFMRADLEAMTEYHRRGTAPVWRDFFAEWNRDVAAGRRAVHPFRTAPVPQFHPARIPLQEVLQKRDGKSPDEDGTS
jgi:hypothetical protein